ncbi:MAG TPA: magnesium/cobalt transporter CorA [Edaphocola sp.]|nr:magnesium/cobalt transporter CorA [Edaphocola sp.]
MKISEIIDKYTSPIQLFNNTLRRENLYHPDSAKQEEPEAEIQKKIVNYTIVQFNEQEADIFKSKEVKDCLIENTDTDKILWINVDGIKKKEVRRLCNNYKVHNLLINDILSIGQRAKTDEIDEHYFCLLPILSYNPEFQMVEQKQVTILLARNMVISFQPDSDHDSFIPIKQKLKNKLDSIRKKSADYLFYELIDGIVDEYFKALDLLSHRLSDLERKALSPKNKKNILIEISSLRNEIMIMRRAMTPVKDVVFTLWQANTPLIENRNARYFKDIYDHILLAIEYNDGYREMTVALQDLYMNQVNTRMNEVMKILTMATVLLAPATVIGGIFGMNFDKIPMVHNQVGFFITIGIMIITSILMIWYFRKKGWF